MPRQLRPRDAVAENAVDSQAYAELVLSLKPAVYYRMEQPGSEKDRFVVLDSAPGGHHGELRLGNEFGGSPYRPGRFGDAIWFRGPEAGDRVIVPDYPKTTNGRLTVSAWVMATGRPVWAMIASNWGLFPRAAWHRGNSISACIVRDKDLSACVTQRDGQRRVAPGGGFHTRSPCSSGSTWPWWPTGPPCTCTATARKWLPPRPPASCSSRRWPAWASVAGRTRPAPDASPDSPGATYYWQGRIDELAIFNQALSAGQIERSVASGEPGKA